MHIDVAATRDKRRITITYCESPSIRRAEGVKHSPLGGTRTPRLVGRAIVTERRHTPVARGERARRERQTTSRINGHEHAECRRLTTNANAECSTQAWPLL